MPPRPGPAAVRRVACVGLGNIGGGLCTHFLRSGLDVVCYDPAPDAADKLRAMIEDKWPLMERLGLAIVRYFYPILSQWPPPAPALRCC